MKSILKGFAAGCAVAGALASTAAAQEVTIGYQGVYNPWKVAIADGAFEAATGATIRWEKFDSGSKVITAMASGDVHIAMAGSSPIAAGISRGLPIALFWIVEDIKDAEALVVRPDIQKPEDLKGRKIGVPFVSTTHFHMLFALETWGIAPDSVEILNMQPNAIAAAWERGDIDGAFIWDPALGRLKEDGRVMITSGELSALGKATYDGMIVNTAFADANPDFMCKFVATIAAADAAYRDNPEAFGGDSDNAAKIVSLAGGEPSQVPDVLALYGFPTLAEQASEAWLGGGAASGAAKSIMATSEFLKAQGQIDAVMPDYGFAVRDTYVNAALAGC